MTLFDTSIQLSEKIKSKHDWTLSEIKLLLEKSLMDLLWEAQIVHRQVNPDYKVQLASLLSVKTGGCQEDCAYCPQSIHSSSDISDIPDQLAVSEVLAQAKMAKEAGAHRFCMGGKP